ncbi:MAG: pantoate--beta-alanine ligase [Flavobacteriia bacterium]|nr:pantoate--beta-alanine ligase [Flavobacteriia bacterium]
MAKTVKKDLVLSACVEINCCKLLVINNVSDLTLQISELKSLGKKIGFVPTMGALHIGHASLMKRSVRENDITVVSIFVNPRQFNNPEDLAKYPRTIETDIEFVEKTGVDIVFIPEEDDVYPVNFSVPEVDLGRLEVLMEGRMRPGHFDGVVQVLTRFFQLVQPDNAYFGLKDFQQVAVVRKMVEYLHLPVNIIACPIYRESSGLAFSSRNQRLTEAQKEEALFIYKSLLKAKELAKKMTPVQIAEIMKQDYSDSSMELEYFEIVDPVTLESLTDEWTPDAVACVVAYVGEVRLIDNMQLN